MRILLMGKEKISDITEQHTEDKSEIDSKYPISGIQENVGNTPSKKSLKRVRFALDHTTVTATIVEKALEDSVYSSATTDPTPQKRLKSCLRELTTTSTPIKKRRLVNTKTAEYRTKYDLKNIKPLNIPELHTTRDSFIISQPMGFFDNPSHKAEQENDVIKAPTLSESNSP
jgi:hypothetical protein